MAVYYFLIAELIPTVICSAVTAIMENVDIEGIDYIMWNEVFSWTKKVEKI